MINKLLLLLILYFFPAKIHSQWYAQNINATKSSNEREVLGVSSTTLIVYDILGREITTLVNEAKQPGTYEVEFNAEGLPSGVYYYQLKAGSLIETKKMIILK